jgi:hypothetical protein
MDNDRGKRVVDESVWASIPLTFQPALDGVCVAC